MRIITTAMRLSELSARWKQEYCRPDGSWSYPDKEPIYDALIKASPLTAKKAERVIGNTSWTRMYCDECGELVETVVQVGEEPGYDSSTAFLCVSCATKAYEMIKAAIL